MGVIDNRVSVILLTFCLKFSFSFSISFNLLYSRFIPSFLVSIEFFYSCWYFFSFGSIFYNRFFICSAFKYSLVEYFSLFMFNHYYGWPTGFPLFNVISGTWRGLDCMMRGFIFIEGSPMLLCCCGMFWLNKMLFFSKDCLINPDGIWNIPFCWSTPLPIWLWFVEFSFTKPDELLPLR